MPENVLGRAKLTAVATGDDELFIGIAPTREVDDYLAGVAHARVTDVGQPSRYVTTEGGPPATLPDAVDVWVASSSGTGTVAMTWPVEDGDWTLVVMNSDAGRGVEAEVAAGATVPWLDEAVAVCLSLGGTGVVLSSVALVLIVRSAGRDSRPL